MISKFQFETVRNLLAAGITNCIQIRQQAGLTGDELDDVIEHFDYYVKHFEEIDRIEKQKQLQADVKKPWWKRK